MLELTIHVKVEWKLISAYIINSFMNVPFLNHIISVVGIF
jgi:hypothetical protein